MIKELLCEAIPCGDMWEHSEYKCDAGKSYCNTVNTAAAAILAAVETCKDDYEKALKHYRSIPNPITGEPQLYKDITDDMVWKWAIDAVLAKLKGE